MKNKIMIALTMTAALMAACGTTQTDGNNVNETSSASVLESASSEESASTSRDTTASSATNGIQAFDKSATIEETTLYDQGGVSIRADSLTCDDSEVHLHLTVTNQSDQTLTVVSGSMGYCWNSINDYMVEDGYINSDIMPGNKAVEDVTFDIDTLQMYGISAISDIKIAFQITDPNDNSVYTGPLDLQTSLYADYDAEADPYQSVITSDALAKAYQIKPIVFTKDSPVKTDMLTVTSSFMAENQDGETVVLLEVQNAGSEDRYFQINEICINGLKVCSSNWSSTGIISGCRAIVPVNLDDVLSEQAQKKLELGTIQSAEFSVDERLSDSFDSVASADISVTAAEGSDEYSAQGATVYDENGLTIQAAGNPFSEEDDSLYDHALFVVTNHTGSEITLDSQILDSLSANGTMVDCILYALTLSDGQTGLLDFQITQDDLQAAGIGSPDAVTSLEASLDYYIGEGGDSQTIQFTADYS